MKGRFPMSMGPFLSYIPDRVGSIVRDWYDYYLGH